MKAAAWLIDDGDNPLYPTIFVRDSIEAMEAGWKVTPLSALPPGYAVVPIEPSAVMIDAISDCIYNDYGSVYLWKMVIEAAQREQT
jgi:hypothetical protein